MSAAITAPVEPKGLSLGTVSLVSAALTVVLLPVVIGVFTGYPLDRDREVHTAASRPSFSA